MEEKEEITSICLSKCGRFLLTNVSLKSPRIDLWDLNRKERIGRFVGHK